MLRRLSILLRILLGAVFIYAAYTKLRQPWLLFAMSIDAYRILPAWAVFSVARTLPWIELALGVLLIAGICLRYSAPVSTLLLLSFYAAMFRAFGTGSGIDCGCFGVGEAISPATLTRDGVLVAASVVLSVVAWRAA